MPRMTKGELLGLIGSEIDNSYGADDGELSDQLTKAIDYYNGENFGNEEEGKSQVISRDVMDVIEWVMPSLMRIFTSSERAVEFDPVQPGDEQAAKQETDIVNHVFYKENDGFLNIYTFFKDALLSKTGIMKVWWSPQKETEREEYQGLTDDELAILLSDKDVEPIEHEEENGLHEITVIRTKSEGSAKVEAIPPEEFLISKDAKSIDPKKARFTCHKTLKTRSELIEMGFSKKKVKDLPTGSTLLTSSVRLARNNLEDDFSQDSNHDSTRQIEVFECYYHVDFNGDGIAELRQITLAGNQILLNEEVDRVPFTAITPVINTHKFYGLSIADMVMDIQLIKSTLMRGVLDNTYLANNGRTAIQEGMVNLEDLLSSRSGGVVRTQGPPANVAMPMPYTPLPPQTLEVMAQLDSMRKERTGVSQDTMGLESNVLANGRTGVINQSFDMAQMRTELIARIFADIGLKSVMRDLHAILQKNQNKQKWIQLRGEWVDVRPDEWRTRYNMTVNVGLGSGNKDRQMQSVMQVIGLQKESQNVSPEGVFAAQNKLVELSGLGDGNKYFDDPVKKPPEPPPPDPQQELVKAQIELTAQQVQVARSEMETNRQEAIWKHDEAMKKLVMEDQRERYKIELQYGRNVPGGLSVV